MKIHPKIDPALVRALKATRARFVKQPTAYDGGLTYVYRKCGCIVAWVKHEAAGPRSRKTCHDFSTGFPASQRMLDRMFDQSSLERNATDPKWAIRRIDKALATNT
jgi:hypothetical protein